MTDGYISVSSYFDYYVLSYDPNIAVDISTGLTLSMFYSFTMAIQLKFTMISSAYGAYFWQNNLWIPYVYVYSSTNHFAIASATDIVIFYKETDLSKVDGELVIR